MVSSRTKAVFPLGCASALHVKYDSKIKITLKIIGVMDIDHELLRAVQQI